MDFTTTEIACRISIHAVILYKIVVKTTRYSKTQDNGKPHLANITLRNKTQAALINVVS